MRVIISAGGTGGHIYPAIAIINRIKQFEPDSEFLYIGTHNRMEKDIIPKLGIPYKSIEIYGLNKNLFKNFKTLKCLIRSNKECKKIISEFEPDIVIGVGGYVTNPVIKQAKKLGYKTVIHEQNSMPGKSNLLLQKYADKILVSFEESINNFDKKKTVFTGNPCSEDSINIKPATKEEFNLDYNKKLVLIVMGSLGSLTMTEFLIKLFDKMSAKDYEVIFVTGNAYYDSVCKMNIPNNIHVYPYIDNLSRVMKIADVMVTRAGASTLSEIISLEVPTILVPSPYVANNHQYKNALALKNNNACILIEEKKLTEDKVLDSIDKILNDTEYTNSIKNNLSKMSIRNSATKIYEVIKELVGR